MQEKSCYFVILGMSCDEFGFGEVELLMTLVIVRIAENTEDTEDAEGRGFFVEARLPRPICESCEDGRGDPAPTSGLGAGEGTTHGRGMDRFNSTLYHQVFVRLRPVLIASQVENGSVSLKPFY